MGRLAFADRDGAGWRTMQRRREADIAFLEKCRAATSLQDVRELMKNEPGPRPEWRHVALMRALKRVCLMNGEK